MFRFFRKLIAGNHAEQAPRKLIDSDIEKAASRNRDASKALLLVLKGGDPSAQSAIDMVDNLIGPSA